MFRRAVVLGTVLAAVAAPSSQAADSFVIEASAASTPAAGGQMLVALECAAADTTATRVTVWCEVGQLRATTLTAGPAAAGAGAGLMPAFAWELCVGAVSYGAQTRSFYECAGMDPLTRTAVITD